MYSDISQREKEGGRIISQEKKKNMQYQAAFPCITLNFSTENHINF